MDGDPAEPKCRRTPPVVNIFIDIDHTMIGEDNSLRPGVLPMLTELTSAGHHLYAWSGDGMRTRTIWEHGLAPSFGAVFRKPTSRYREAVSKFDVSVDFVVDDYSQIVRVLGGVCVSPYVGSDDKGNESGDLVAAVDAVAVHTGHARRNQEFDLWFYSGFDGGLQVRHFVENVLVASSQWFRESST